MNTKLIGALLVSLAANAALAADAPAVKKADAKVEMACQNNSCKGKSECMGFGNAGCAGGNECKGKGILKAKTEADCVKKTGLWIAKK